MSHVTNLPPSSSAPSAETTVVADRRRPGRLEQVSSELVPILRGQIPDPAPAEPLQFDQPDQLAAARGLAVGVLLSAPLWICVAYIARWVLS